jgi:hypothetical protein
MCPPIATFRAAANEAANDLPFEAPCRFRSLEKIEFLSDLVIVKV